MCRIIGEVSFSNQPSSFDDFKSLTALSKAGGPDATGFWADESCRLGFNRLAILDVSANGNQPVLSPSGRYAMVFNGEIYNYRQLRQKYGIDVAKLRSTADTEVVVQLLDLISLDVLVNELDGMFAIAVWDTLLKQLFLIRDFAGIKPLHYGVNSQGVVFASQYNQVARHEWFSRSAINSPILATYLRRHYIPAPNGLLENTFQVAPGEMVTIDMKGNIQRKQYWQLPSFFKATVVHEHEAVDYVSHHLEEAVKAQLMADVPLGAFLSGGVDSPLICRYAQNNIPDRLKTFTIGSDSLVHDETDMARLFATSLDADASFERMDSRYAADLLNSAMGALTEPFADFSILPTFLVCRLARQKVAVALSGDGGDELFFGYERFWSVGKNIKYQSWPYPLKYLLYGVDKVAFNSRNINSAVLASSQGVAHQSLHSRISAGQFEAVAPDLKYDNDFLSPEYSYANECDSNKLLQRMRVSEFYDMMQKTLRKVDSASMANSLEVRVPFLQKSFIEASLNVDGMLSYGATNRKGVLKGLLQKLYPNIDYRQPKMGFTIPLQKWIQNGLKHHFQEVLLDSSMNHRFGFSKPHLEVLMNEHIAGKQDHKWVLFTIYSLYKWQQGIKG
ncbi:MAG: asparagine synthase (glutamine-hydrolyzing) [Breznakibacter sp.]